MRGYAVVDGDGAWIVYYGYKIKCPMNPSEMNLAARFRRYGHSADAESQSSEAPLAQAQTLAQPQGWLARIHAAFLIPKVNKCSN